MLIKAEGLSFREMNDRLRAATEADVRIEGCLGQRYIAAGMSGLRVEIEGTPGNALGAYLSGCDIVVHGNAQDATGDTMDSGNITIYGNSGDATGYAMRGGGIYVQGNVGYRAGIHMKAYQEKSPCLLVGGCAGSFLGEYQAGGTIVVLGLHKEEGRPLVGHFCGNGMHGGRMYLRADTLPYALPEQVRAHRPSESDMAALRPLLDTFCAKFGEALEPLLQDAYFVLEPDTGNPYKALYTAN